MSCIGTAGHVDHGKSTLVKALTGIDPDRLVEEKERGMTIDLGFAWLKLPSGQEMSIVDVPGHENFIKNMLAGVGSIDAALLVIAADEGIMPQTREHLAILDLLHISHGVIALTKTDLVDAEWLEMVQGEIAEYLKPTTLSGAKILPVSAYTGQGLPELLAELDRLLEEETERKNIGRPRLPIDRVFSLTGFGTIVTGTLLDGTLKTGQEVMVLPQGIATRIRTVQTHKQQIEVAQPGSRVAINLANVARSDLARGNVVVLSGQQQTTMLLDARLKLLPDAVRPLVHNTEVDFYNGSQEVPARVRLLDTDELQPGKSAWVQLRLNRPVVLARKDRFIIRIPSPSMTIGGGEVIDVTARYHRRFQKAIVASLERIAHGTPEELVLAVLERRSAVRAASKVSASSTAKTASLQPGCTLEEVVKQSNLALDVTQQTLETLLTSGRVYKVGGYWFARHIWEVLVDEAMHLVQEHQQKYPLRSGLSKEEWRTRLSLTPKMAAEVFAALQVADKLQLVTAGSPAIGHEVQIEVFARAGGLIRTPDFQPSFTPEQQRQVEQLLQKFRANPYTPPVRSEAETMVGAEVVNALIEQGQIIQLGEGILFLRPVYNEVLAKVVAFLRENGKMTVAEARDAIGTTRKYILPLLEHLDTLRITRREGDERVLGNMQIDQQMLL